MTDNCSEVRKLSAEVALGIASGDERSRVLEHITRCPACRGELEQLSRTADDLLLLAPPREPPLGFETGVLRRLTGRPRRRWRQALQLAAAALAAAVATGAVMLALFSDDRRLASDYRQSLAEVNGKYFEAEQLRDGRGNSVGQVFAYEGSPRWVTIVLRGGVAPGTYVLELTTQEGRRVRLRPLHVRRGVDTTVRTLPVRLDDVTRLRLFGSRPGIVLEAQLRES